MLHAADLPLAVRSKLGVTEKRRTKQSADAEMKFLFQAQHMRLPPVFAQWRFAKSTDPNNPRKKWRTDFVFHDYALMIEIDGGIWVQGAHAHPTDIIRNMSKGNDAALLGFTVLHFTPAEVKSGYAISFTETVLKSKGWKR